jgi:sugar phosphate isomerase/epimerase
MLFIKFMSSYRIGGNLSNLIMDEQLKTIVSKVFVAVPFVRWRNEFLDKGFELGVSPELGVSADALDRFSRADFEEAARLLEEHGLKRTLHAPFMDLCPASSDPLIRAASQRRIIQALDLIPVFKPVSVVCHLGFFPLIHEEIRDEWLERAVSFWSALVPRLEEYDTPLMLENVFEWGPEIFEKVLRRVNSPYIRFCFDTGHTLAFSKTPWREWLNALGEYLGQLHAHDNAGNMDEHRAIGKGRFPFQELFKELAQSNLRPIITLEAHSEQGVRESFPALNAMWPWPD